MNYKEFLEQAIKECTCKADFCRVLGKKPTGGNYATIDKIIKDYNLDCSHFRQGAWNKDKHYRATRYDSLEEILIQNSLYKTTSHLKDRLINAQLLENKCAVCGKTERLELHHINGDSSDNRLENLQILCVECHYDTPNFRNKLGQGRIHSSAEELYIVSDEELRIRSEARILAKRRSIPIREAIELINNSPNKSIKDFPKKIPGGYEKLENIECPICHKVFHPRNKEQKYCSQECVRVNQQKMCPTKEQLIKQLKESNCNFAQAGRDFGVTDNAIRKWCKKYELPWRTKELKEVISTL